MKKLNVINLIAVTTLTLSGAGAAFAQEEMSRMSQGPSTYKISSVDQLVLSKIHHADQVEIKAGKLALQRSTSPDVKTVANQIIKDHTEADVQVKQVAQADNIRLQVPLAPQNDEEKKMMAQHKAELENLKKLHGVAFDTEYQKLMVAAHQRDLAELTSVEPKLKQENTKQLVQSLIPKFQHHEHLLANLNPSAETKTAQNEEH